MRDWRLGQGLAGTRALCGLTVPSGVVSGVHAVIANLLCHARDDAMDLVDPIRQ
jgi:hypothetical protein